MNNTTVRSRAVLFIGNGKIEKTYVNVVGFLKNWSEQKGKTQYDITNLAV